MLAVLNREIGTSISEASTRFEVIEGLGESFYFFLCYPGRQAGEFLFSTEELGPSPRLRSVSLQADLSLKV
jgi:hypothetical protein